MFERRSAELLRCYREDHRTAPAVLGLMSVALLLIGGVAIDYARVVDMRSRLTNAVESASLEAAQALRDGFPNNQIETRTLSSFETDAASARKLGTIETPSIIVDRARGTITIQVTGKVATTVSRIAGFHEIPVPVISKTVYPLRDARVDPATSSNHRAPFRKRA
ncbi:MAG TPA: pilus assembly protein TadG-related protein [Hyphomicrobium sp.]|jgi:Flp pilus assembly protein TadG